MSLLWAVCQLIAVSFCLTLRNSLTNLYVSYQLLKIKIPTKKVGKIISSVSQKVIISGIFSRKMCNFGFKIQDLCVNFR